MAIGQSDGSIILTTKVDSSGLSKGLSKLGGIAKGAGKAIAAVGVAASAAAVAITKASVSAYADYEQLVGGVETLFKDSAGKVLAYAENAFATAGMSANEYMKNVTSFSASLISSTAGDTEKAADIANMAMIDMSDNANKMGSSMESITMAYQGFSKQQYMLLDNLKLGYGGTKGEMERLLKDAQALTGVKYDISNLADVYSAIHAIQENLGIAGTTAKEAEATISGSAQMMKSAWQNVLVAISGGGDLDRAINNLVYSISKYFENIVPVVERALQGIGALIERVAPLLVQTVARALIKAIPSLLNAVYQMIIGLAKGIYEGIIALFSGNAVKAIEKQTNEIEQSVKNQNALTEAVEETAEAQEKSLVGFDKLNILSGKAAEEEIVPAVNTPSAGGTSLLGDMGATETQANGFVQKLLTILEPITTALGNLFEPIKQSFNRIDWNGMTMRFGEWGKKFTSSSIDAMAKAVDSLRVAFEILEEPLGRLWTNALEPIINQFGVWIIEIVDQIGEAFGYFTEKLKEYEDEIAIIVDAVSEWLEFLWAFWKPQIQALVDSILPVLNAVIDVIFFIIDAIAELFLAFKNTFSGIKALIEGDTKEATKFFTKALANLVNVFVAVANAIIGVINGLWELIFNSFKGFVNGVGGMINKIGEWLGLDWDLKWDAKAPLIPYIPKYVPKLATGAVIPGGREFMAILGDQPAGYTNIEAPEDLIRQIVREESGGKNFTIKATGSMAQLIRLLSLEITEEQNRVSVF